jgi:hypothetical protein
VARQVNIRVEGLKDAREMVGDVGDRARRPEVALRSGAVLDALHASERRRFSQPWRPGITRAWAARKRREGLDPRVMRATGALERTLETGRPPAVTFRAWNGTLRWGLPARSPVWYAAVQAKRGRKAVVIDKQAKADIGGRVLVWIVEGRT